jgi:hypothetical protein
MSQYIMDIVSNESISEDIVSKAAKLFSDHYGIWGSVAEQKTKGRMQRGK